MIAAFDVDYDDACNTALAAAVVFDSWEADHATDTRTSFIESVAGYEPGAFYKRELPSIRALVQWSISRWGVNTVVVDGFVDLDEGKPGFGRYLAREISDAIEVIGVAKRAFRGEPGIAITRGVSKQPLWVTSTHDAHRAADHVRTMRGEHRIPTLLKAVDSLARGRPR